MKLIIAEKPSLARNIVSALDKCTQKNGYYENGEYIVTWAFGHLFSLFDIEDYTGEDKGKRWTMDNLPYFPEEFRFKLKEGKDKSADKGVAAQFGKIKRLIERSDVDTVINAGDADREGEIIVRQCILNSNYAGKSIKRLWLPDQTTQTISKALAAMEDDSKYDDLANEGFARTYIDWLYGINLTRYATLKTGVLLRVGRVIVPIVKAIYDRDMAIRNFVPEKYFSMTSEEKTKGEAIELVSKNRFNINDRASVEAKCALYNSTGAYVLSTDSKTEELRPGKLYSLTKLQNVLGRRYKMSMDESLAILQKLYESGYITYPRTNSEYLASAEQGKMKAIIENIAKLGYPVEFKFKKSIFDDSKIEAHSALTPTYKIPEKDKLSEKEFTVYSTIFRRFVAVFCSKPCKVERSEIVIRIDGQEDFVLKGMVIREKGWTAYDDYTVRDKILPALEKGEKVNIDFRPVEKDTTPPKHYTIETLNNYLKNPFKDEKEREDETSDDDDYKAVFEGLELGTEATRTGIIQNAIKSKYISLKKDVYTILPQGEYLIVSLVSMNISMDKYKTSDLGRALKKVYKGQMSIDESVGLAVNEIKEVFDKKTGSGVGNDTDTGVYRQIIGICPVCGSKVARGRYKYGCVNYGKGCDFAVNCFICQRAISVTSVQSLLKTGRTPLIKGFISKTGKPFDAYLVLNESKKAVFDFGNKG